MKPITILPYSDDSKLFISEDGDVYKKLSAYPNRGYKLTTKSGKRKWLTKIDVIRRYVYNEQLMRTHEKEHNRTSQVD